MFSPLHSLESSTPPPLLPAFCDSPPHLFLPIFIYIYIFARKENYFVSVGWTPLSATADLPPPTDSLASTPLPQTHPRLSMMSWTKMIFSGPATTPPNQILSPPPTTQPLPYQPPPSPPSTITIVFNPFPEFSRRYLSTIIVPCFTANPWYRRHRRRQRKWFRRCRNRRRRRSPNRCQWENISTRRRWTCRFCPLLWRNGGIVGFLR